MSLALPNCRYAMTLVVGIIRPHRRLEMSALMISYLQYDMISCIPWVCTVHLVSTYAL